MHPFLHPSYGATSYLLPSTGAHPLPLHVTHQEAVAQKCKDLAKVTQAVVRHEKKQCTEQGTGLSTAEGRVWLQLYVPQWLGQAPSW